MRPASGLPRAGPASAQPDPSVSPGLQLQPAEAATTVGGQDGWPLTTDGPCVVAEAMAGYVFFDADDLDAAIEPGGAVRPPGWATRWRCARSWNSRSSSRSSATRGARSVTSLSGLRGDFALAEEAAEES